MSSLFQPVTQKRLTNIAIVRYKTHGKRLEIACYKNKVLDWREGVEKNLSEVIQTDTVFENVSKGIVAKEKDLVKIFQTKDNEEICRKILKCGELQVSDREREAQLEGIFRDIVQMVVDRVVHAKTGRLHTPIAVEGALKTVGFSVLPDHTAKKQALKAIETLCTQLPESFRRAQMRLRIVCPEALLAETRKHLVDVAHARIEEETSGTAQAPSCSLTFVVDPRQYRDLDHFATVTHANAGVSLQIVTAAVLGDVSNNEALGVQTSADLAPPPTVVATAPASATSDAPKGGAVATPARRGMRCSSCAADFEDAKQYRAHCRSEWHNFNLKRKVKEIPPATEEEYAEISLDVREGFLAVEA
eukprot:TRINITY_DN29728_c0_g1_i1.p1 TRINITY_DN29728_c0_g1~~TRINITY_DN29728_c0_g1_i1.p1  ORF type:complete len:360 (+),score=77.44 TRINITY_DN29728_c0_g1_i1:126-1205(+)